jgi:hypothetical protein
MKQRIQQRESGVALVTTMIVVAVLAIVAVAFMQSTSTDRLSSRTGKNYMQARLAAEAGLAAAEAVLARATTNDTFIVVANTNRQLFVGNGTNDSVNFIYVPAFSTVASLTTVVAPIVSAEVPSTNVPAGPNSTNFIFTNMPGGYAATSPPSIAWVYMTNANGTTNGRFAYWVEDLGGRLDLSVVGTNTSSPVARRPTGTNPAEIALWSLLDSTSVSAAASGGAGDALVTARANLLTAATARLADPSVTTNSMADLTAGVVHDTNEPMLIPFGFGYPKEGEAKLDLNTADFAGIVESLTNNLPDFGDRGGGLAKDDYVKNVAASIVDFIDADLTPTAGDGYRGVEPIPFLNERMTRFVLQGPPVNEGRGWVINIETTEYFEFWNLHNRTSVATTVDFAYTNNQPLQYSGSTNFNIVTNVSIAIPAMPPGSYFVTNSPTLTNRFSVNSFASPSANPICTLVGNSRTVQYRLSAGGAVYDRGSGSHYSDKPLRGGDLVYFSGSYPGLGSKRSIAGVNDADFLNSVGDPRATYFMVDGGQPRPQIQPSWTSGNTSFGGRTLQSGMSTARLSKEVRMENWGDGGHSGIAGVRGSGTTPPPTGLFATAETAYAPALANPNISGRLDRITDLAGIFDPLQWGERNQSAAWPNEPGAWTNLTSAATNITAYAGGHSLRFGRPEFTRFTNNGTRAAQLLDALAVSPGTNSESGTLLNTVPGRININTAGTNALRALAAGVFHTNDPRLVSGTGAGTNFVVPKAAVDGFVTGVTNFRSTRPFYSPSQLPLISTNSDGSGWPGSAVFGNWTLMGITAGNDAATEEWFSRVYSLTTVRSRNFLVHVVGQALQTNGLTVLSTERSAFQIYLLPVRDPAGLTTNSIPRLIRSWSL